MQSPDLPPDDSGSGRDALERQIRTLQERLAFYEGFDRLIQDNIAQARELFRLAAQEREEAAAVMDRARHEAGRCEAHLRGELELIASDLRQLSRLVEALSDRVARALGEPAGEKGAANGVIAAELRSERPVAVVMHGVPSAREALSLQRFVGSLPQVADVSAREYVGGVLRLDARVRDRLDATQFLAWGDPGQIEALAERPDVLELVLREPTTSATGG